MTDGIIELDTDRGRLLGFTSDRFGEGSYLWKDGSAIVVSFVESLARGNFRQLADAILARHWTVKIPTPLGRMEQIVRKAGYVQSWPYCKEFGACVELWTKEPA